MYYVVLHIFTENEITFKKILLQLRKHENTPLKKEEIQKLWLALQTNTPIEIAKAIMLLPSVKSCLKYQFLEQMHLQCQDLCVRKHGTNGPSVLHVPRKNTKSSLEEFSWDTIIEEMKERAPDVLDFISTFSVPIVHQNGSQVAPVCVAYGQMMNTRWRELSLVHKVITFILGIGHSTRKVGSPYSYGFTVKEHEPEADTTKYFRCKLFTLYKPLLHTLSSPSLRI